MEEESPSWVESCIESCIVMCFIVFYSLWLLIKLVPLLMLLASPTILIGLLFSLIWGCDDGITLVCMLKYSTQFFVGGFIIIFVLCITRVFCKDCLHAAISRARI